MIPTAPSTLKDLVNMIIGYINILIPTILVIVFVWTIWKVFDAWVINAGDEKKIEEGKGVVLTSVIVFVIIIALWGLIQLLRESVFGY